MRTVKEKIENPPIALSGGLELFKVVHVMDDYEQRHYHIIDTPTQFLLLDILDFNLDVAIAWGAMNMAQGFYIERGDDQHPVACNFLRAMTPHLNEETVFPTLLAALTAGMTELASFNQRLSANFPLVFPKSKELFESDVHGTILVQSD